MHRVAIVMPDEANCRAIMTTCINNYVHIIVHMVHKTPYNIIWFVHILFNVWQWGATCLSSFHHTQLLVTLIVVDSSGFESLDGIGIFFLQPADESRHRS